MHPKLKSSVSVVKINESMLEFFKTNTRENILLQVENDLIMEIVGQLDGINSLDEISEKFKVQKDDLESLLEFLTKRGVLETVNPSDLNEYSKYRRVLHFLSDYSNSPKNLSEMWKNIRNSRVLIIGMGAVGSWTAINLLQSGVRNFILMDPDTVDMTNLHRQFSYHEGDIGKLKVDVIEERMMEIAEGLEVVKIVEHLGNRNLQNLIKQNVDLVINCADKPNVDLTSQWVGKYCMKNKIPHIVGGGYNLHLSLIGQTILPFKSACVKCFEQQLEELNEIDTTRVKKLEVKNRKVGSFGPMCSLIASFIGMEALKVLSKHIAPSNINRRGEFDIYKMNISYKNFERRKDCEWCGEAAND